MNLKNNLENRVIIVTDETGKFYQNRNANQSLDVALMVGFFESNGFEVSNATFIEIGNNISDYKGYYIFATSSYDKRYKILLEEICFELEKYNVLLPKYEHFIAHENKIYQELYKKRVCINSLKFMIVTELNSAVLCKVKTDIHYPFIVKLDSGAGGLTVYKVRNEKEFIGVFNKIPVKRKKLIILFKNFIKKILNKYFSSTYEMSFDTEASCTRRIVIQEMIPNLSHDWKVLIFGKKIFVLKRNVPNNDFRASGQGMLDFDAEPPREVLKYAYEIFKKIDTPHISLDIAQGADEKCHLIEYQVNAFGPTTMLDSKYEYNYINENEFVKKENLNILEELYVYSLIEYISNE